MSVVYLPEDKRWSLVGEGIGSLVGTFVGQKLKERDDQRVMQLVHQINSDDTIKSEDKPYRIGEIAGTKGLALQQGLLKLQQSGIVTQKDVAQTQEAQARTSQITQQTRQQAADAPLKQKILEGDVAAQPGKQALTAAQTEHAQAGTVKEGVEAQKTAQELQDWQAQRDALARTLAAQKPPEGIDPAQWYSIQLEGALGGPKAAASGIAKASAANAAAAQVGPKAESRAKAEQKAKEGTVALPEATSTAAAGSAKMAVGLGSVLDAVEHDPKSTGGITAYVKGWATEHGYALGDPLFTQQLAASQQLVASSAQTGTSFGGKWKVDLAKTISPTVVKGKVYQIQEADQVSTDALAYWENKKLNYAGQYNTKQIDDTIAQLTKIKEQADTLWWTKDGKAIFYKGKQVNSETLQPIKDGARELTSDTKIGNTTFVAKDINDAARAKGLTPQQVIEALRAKMGGDSAPSGSQ